MTTDWKPTIHKAYTTPNLSHPALQQAIPSLIRDEIHRLANITLFQNNFQPSYKSSQVPVDMKFTDDSLHIRISKNAPWISLLPSTSPMSPEERTVDAIRKDVMEKIALLWNGVPNSSSDDSDQECPNTSGSSSRRQHARSTITRSKRGKRAQKNKGGNSVRKNPITISNNKIDCSTHSTITNNHLPSAISQPNVSAETTTTKDMGSQTISTEDSATTMESIIKDSVNTDPKIVDTIPSQPELYKISPKTPEEVAIPTTVIHPNIQTDVEETPSTEDSQDNFDSSNDELKHNSTGSFDSESRTGDNKSSPSNEGLDNFNLMHLESTDTDTLKSLIPDLEFKFTRNNLMDSEFTDPTKPLQIPKNSNKKIREDFLLDAIKIAKDNLKKNPSTTPVDPQKQPTWAHSANRITANFRDPLETKSKKDVTSDQATTQATTSEEAPLEFIQLAKKKKESFQDPSDAKSNKEDQKSALSKSDKTPKQTIHILKTPKWLSNLRIANANKSRINLVPAKEVKSEPMPILQEIPNPVDDPFARIKEFLREDLEFTSTSKRIALFALRSELEQIQPDRTKVNNLLSILEENSLQIESMPSEIKSHTTPKETREVNNESTIQTIKPKGSKKISDKEDLGNPSKSHKQDIHYKNKKRDPTKVDSKLAVDPAVLEKLTNKEIRETIDKITSNIDNPNLSKTPIPEIENPQKNSTRKKSKQIGKKLRFPPSIPDKTSKVQDQINPNGPVISQSEEESLLSKRIETENRAKSEKLQPVDINSTDPLERLVSDEELQRLENFLKDSITETDAFIELVNSNISEVDENTMKLLHKNRDILLDTEKLLISDSELMAGTTEVNRLLSGLNLDTLRLVRDDYDLEVPFINEDLDGTSTLIESVEEQFFTNEVSVQTDNYQSDEEIELLEKLQELSSRFKQLDENISSSIQKIPTTSTTVQTHDYQTDKEIKLQKKLQKLSEKYENLAGTVLKISKQNRTRDLQSKLDHTNGDITNQLENILKNIEADRENQLIAMKKQEEENLSMKIDLLRQMHSTETDRENQLIAMKKQEEENLSMKIDFKDQINSLNSIAADRETRLIAIIRSKEQDIEQLQDIITRATQTHDEEYKIFKTMPTNEQVIPIPSVSAIKSEEATPIQEKAVEEETIPKSIDTIIDTPTTTNEKSELKVKPPTIRSKQSTAFESEASKHNRNLAAASMSTLRSEIIVLELAIQKNNFPKDQLAAKQTLLKRFKDELIRRNQKPESKKDTQNSPRNPLNQTERNRKDLGKEPFAKQQDNLTDKRTSKK